MSTLLPREWMDPAKRPPRIYLFPWQLSMLDTYDQNPQLVNLFNEVFHEPVQNPHVPHSLAAFKTVFDFPPLPHAWRDPLRRPRNLSQWQKDVLECYDKDPFANIHLFDDWEHYHQNRIRRSELKRVGPSAQNATKVFSNVGKLAGADNPDFDPPIEPPFKIVTRRRYQQEESCQKGKVWMREYQNRKIYDSICSIESMICGIKKKLSLSKQ